MPAWLLPDHIADVLPAEARKVEELRRCCLDTARSFGYELVMPPLLEYVDSLLTGAGQDLDLRTFKFADQLSGKTLGLRADITPQVARIDAHLLNRTGVARLCYAGGVLHTLSQGALASREQQQFGAEIYGHAGIEADFEVIELALQTLRRSGVKGSLVVDLNDVRILTGLLQGCTLNAEQHAALLQALVNKQPTELAEIVGALVTSTGAPLPQAQRDGLLALPQLYGGLEVLQRARETLQAQPQVSNALDAIEALAKQVQNCEPRAQINIDLADLRGYHYYSASSFMVYVPGLQHALVRGGRYDEIGLAFGRARPATGFGLYLGDLAGVSSVQGANSAILAPWMPADLLLAQALAALRQAGETVVYNLPGHEHAPDEFAYDRKLVLGSGGWQTAPL